MNYFRYSCFSFLLLTSIFFPQSFDNSDIKDINSFLGHAHFSKAMHLETPTNGKSIDIRGVRTKLDKKFLLSPKEKQQTLNWNYIGTVTTDAVTQSSIASDGVSLVVFIRHPDPSNNWDDGTIYKWNGTSWVLECHPTYECHNPDIATYNGITAATWYDDTHDYGFATDVNGQWIYGGSSWLHHQYGMTVAIAQDCPYVTFACQYTDGQPSTFKMLHVISPIGIGCSADAELNGVWEVPYYSVGDDPSITGNYAGWYCVFQQHGFLYVYNGFQSSGQNYILDVGYGFTVDGVPYDPEIEIYRGRPTVLWLEDAGHKLYVAYWNGTDWILFGSVQTSDYISSARATSIGNDFYLSYVNSSGSPRIVVSKWDGSEWSAIPGVLETSSTSNISTAEITIWMGAPTVCFVEDKKVKVLTLSTTPGITESDIINYKYSLIQNYPNPFNPITRIKFQIPELSFVTLRIYDVLGNELNTIVNEERPAGNYEIEYDATGLPSGIYFYRLQAGSFIETKKMVLIK